MELQHVIYEITDAIAVINSVRGWREADLISPLAAEARSAAPR